MGRVLARRSCRVRTSRADLRGGSDSRKCARIVEVPTNRTVCHSIPVPELCQNPICLGCRELLFEREQVPQVVDIRHFRIELMECLEPEIILRNQQVAGSIPAGGSIFS